MLLKSKKPESKKRTIIKNSLDEIFRNVCFNNNRKYAALETEARYQSYGKNICPLAPSVPFNSLFVSGGVKRGFKYKRSLDIG